MARALPSAQRKIRSTTKAAEAEMKDTLTEESERKYQFDYSRAKSPGRMKGVKSGSSTNTVHQSGFSKLVGKLRGRKKP